MNGEVADEVVDEVVEQEGDEPVKDINWLDVWESFSTPTPTPSLTPSNQRYSSGC